MHKGTILILDKDSHSQWTLKTLLESERYIALAVDKIERVLKNFQEFEISALITEYEFDQLLLEVVGRLKKRFPGLYVMVLTQENLGEEEYKKAIHAGIDDIFLKPISGEKILVHLNKGLRQYGTVSCKGRLELKSRYHKGKKGNRNPSEKCGGKAKPYHEKYSIHPI